MGGELKRVPMDFDYPIGRVWYGYFHKYPRFCHEEYRNVECDDCLKYAKIKGIPIEKSGCPDFVKFYGLPKKLPVDPPVGDGYQLWSTTTEGHPMSPVFASLDELCEWCEKNATTFAHAKATTEQWKKIFNENFVRHEEGNAVFI